MGLMMRIKTLLLGLVVFFLLMPAALAAQSNGRLLTIDAFVHERMESLNIPGAALAIVREGEIVHLAGYGVANEAGDPVTPQTPFLLASLSKPVTAVAVMQLAEAGQIELDAPIQQYLPWLLPDTPITVRHLLHQTSGLDETEGYRRNLEPDAPNALAASIQRLADAELNNPPGTTFEYSNSNYDVLGLLIETVTGQPYPDYIQAHIFTPLAMNNSFTSLSAARAAGMSSAFYPFFGRQTNFDDRMPYTRSSAAFGRTDWQRRRYGPFCAGTAARRPLPDHPTLIPLRHSCAAHARSRYRPRCPVCDGLGRLAV
jgi:CubicO group peptidase (beta-lactamase class C family)